ncbi:bacterial sec-independent translocation protein mttA/Hcf106 [Carex rostrata]
MEIACCSTSPVAASLLLSRSKRSSVATHASLSFSSRRAPQAPPLVSVSRPRRTRSPALKCKCFFGLGVPELVVIAGVAALVFGPKKLPEIGRNIGKTVKGFQQAAKEFETELKQPPSESGASPPEEPQTVAGGEPKKELETSSNKESA